MKRWVVLLLLQAIVVMSLGGCGKSRVSRAEELLKTGSKIEAAKLLSDEISDHPKNAEAYLVYGKVLLNDDRDAAYTRFRSAIKVDRGMISRVEELLSKDPTYSDLCFLADIDPRIMRQNADLCYKYRVEMAPDSSGASDFADAFPSDRRSPKAIEIEAAEHKENGRSDAAKSLFQRIVKEYPKTKEARSAKELLSDWWAKEIIYLRLDHRWQGRSVRKGQQYRYSVRGEVTRETGLGIIRFNANDVWVFEGTQPELRESQHHSYSTGQYFYGYEGPKATKAGVFGSGTASKDCLVWFFIDSDYEISDSLSVEFEVKE